MCKLLILQGRKMTLGKRNFLGSAPSVCKSVVRGSWGDQFDATVRLNVIPPLSDDTLKLSVTVTGRAGTLMV